MISGWGGCETPRAALKTVALSVKQQYFAVLAARGLRPSRVATLDRRVTQPLARTLYGEGLDGLSWWSTLDAGWTNVTLFHERVLPRLTLVSSPEPLTLTTPSLVEAARRLGIHIGARG